MAASLCYDSPGMWILVSAGVLVLLVLFLVWVILVGGGGFDYPASR
jgi:hypothetical protein